MRVRDFCKTDAKAVSPATPLTEVLQVLTEHPLGGVCVVDDENTVVGIVTEEDMLRPLLPEYFEMLDDLSAIRSFGTMEKAILEGVYGTLILAHDVMQEQFHFIEEDETLLKAVALIIKYGLDILPVVRQGKYVGVLNKHELCCILYGCPK